MYGMFTLKGSCEFIRNVLVFNTLRINSQLLKNSFALVTLVTVLSANSLAF